MGLEAHPAGEGSMGELVEQLAEGSCLCSVGQLEVAVGWSAKQTLLKRAGHRSR